MIPVLSETYRRCTVALRQKCLGLMPLVPDLLSHGHGATKSRNQQIHRKLRSPPNSKLFLRSYSVLNREYLGRKIGFMSKRELKYTTFLSQGGQREVSCFPIKLIFTLPHLYC